MGSLQDINHELRDHPGNKYYRVYIGKGGSHDLSDLSVRLQSMTGYYADDYIPPATTIKNIYNIISDESTFKGHSGVSCVLLPYSENTKVEVYENALGSLCQEFGISRIHFADIFGQNTLGTRRRDFLKKFIEIVNGKEKWTISFSANRTNFLAGLSVPDVSDRELYFLFFWNAVERIVEMLPSKSVFHIYFEQDNYLSIDLVKEYIGKLYNGILQCQSLKDKQSSICKHPLFFSKKALLYSSLSDLAAYSNTFLQQKLDLGIPIAKIKRNHGELIETTRLVFSSFTSLHQSDKGAANLVLGEL